MNVSKRLANRLKQVFRTQKTWIECHRQDLRSVAALAGGNILASALSVLGGLLVARYLGPEETGFFRLFTIPMMYLTFLHLGTFDGLYRQIPFYLGKGFTDLVDKVASSAGAWNVLVAVIVSFGFMLLTIVSLLKNDIPAAFGWLTQVVVCWGTYYGCYLGATYRTVSHFVNVAKIQLLQSVTAFLMVLLVPFFAFYGLCLRAAVPAFVGVFFLHKFRPLKINLSIDVKTLKSVIRIGMPLCFWGTLDSSLWMALENTLLLELCGVKELGLFSIAVVLRESLSTLTVALHQVLTPRVVESYAREGSSRLATKKCFVVTLPLVGVMLIIVPVMYLCIDYFVPLLIPKYSEGIPIIKVSLWAAVVQAASLPLNALFATGKGWLYGRGVLAGLLSFIIFSLVFSSTFGGMMAVVLGSLLGRAIRIAVCYFDLLVIRVREERGL